ncbi:hypothetical protein EVAR_84283_1 [Eumeta japonica]|uniref:Uncharacterized protein n=1 Tax=Eumeta variegata TaxID=151549 RepID=A0A4C1WQZ2_EUMVA|nr:hypothetical protein EVAR_84283_1 [Eumeta japonica]
MIPISIMIPTTVTMTPTSVTMTTTSVTMTPTSVTMTPTSVNDTEEYASLWSFDSYKTLDRPRPARGRRRRSAARPPLMRRSCSLTPGRLHCISFEVIKLNSAD